MIEGDIDMAKLPSVEGLEKAQQKFKDLLKKQPSDELVKIVEESTNLYEKEKAPQEKPGKVARNQHAPEAEK